MCYIGIVDMKLGKNISKNKTTKETITQLQVYTYNVHNSITTRNELSNQSINKTALFHSFNKRKNEYLKIIVIGSPLITTS